MLGFATPKSGRGHGQGFGPGNSWRSAARRASDPVLIAAAWFWRRPALAALVLVATTPGAAEDFHSIRSRAETRAREEWSARRAASAQAGPSAPNAKDLAVQLGRACFELAEFASTAEAREALAQEGIIACRSITNGHSGTNHPAANYYLALNLGQLARTKTLGALRLVEEMEMQFHLAIAGNPRLDQAGPDRCLGLLYSRAPGWPASIGNRSKARKHLSKAVQIAPGFPENHLFWMEALLKWKDDPALDAAMANYLILLPAARKEFAGEAWEWSWIDWEDRLRSLQRRPRKREAASRKR